MDENDANLANVSELQAHIDIASARAKSLTPGTTRADEALTDLTDYYERLVQIRRMTITTLEETAKGVAVGHRSTVRRWKVVAAGATAAAVCAGTALAPDLVADGLAAAVPYMTVDRLVTHTIIVFLVFFGGRRTFA